LTHDRSIFYGDIFWGYRGIKEKKVFLMEIKPELGYRMMRIEWGCIQYGVIYIYKYITNLIL
jgi:hypothetical protein